ncbi:SDR family NAD(P)-dependent oxidoreductase [Sphingomonas solaris]|uniref:SDR family NAD(P)-dependent oxidoreductase n=1 Tax=Alterirhizorhabdus solaris TaxID=2529389 RepID=A0A558RAC3_9SPHN|nr:SDR family NAD(P)-dependent oxidoreductase [Sphingomonas solaris]TVV76335.1 SDR family NAD(P)-dependent oxidoreductase [Sphingomonas solaris]
MANRPLEGRLALVTGASRGIGAATALALGQAGAHVVLTARTAGGLEEVEDRIHAAGGTATIAPLDLAENDSIARLATAIAGRWKALDLLVLNAAMLGTLTPVPAIDGKEFAKLFTLNVTAQQAMLAAFDPMLRASDDARVVGLTSSVGQRPRAYWGAYGASKAALESLLLSYADEMKAISKVRVAIVDPGATATAMRARAYPGEDAATLQQPEDVAAAILRLVSEPFVTGFRLRVAGSARDQAEAV